MNQQPVKFSPILAPKSLNVIMLPIYDHFAGRTFHSECCNADWDEGKLRKDFEHQTVASEGCKAILKNGSELFLETNLLFKLEPDVFGFFTKSELFNYVTVCAPDLEQAKAKMNWLVSKYIQKPEIKPHFNLVSHNGSHLHMQRVDLDVTNKLDESDMDIHYGNGFTTWHTNLIKNLSEKSHGITLLQGDPGTGKTTYLRHLILSLSATHRFLYLPLDQTRFMNEIRSVDFWRNQKMEDSERKLVVILEDAEEFLLKRESGRMNTKVADLLNIGDGLMGDFLQLHLICTINCSVDTLDKAITRSGRLMGYRRFQRLPRKQAQQIARNKNLSLPDQQDYSLAEIYNGQVLFEEEVGNRTIGFANNFAKI
jgi:hypothetical protein